MSVDFCLMLVGGVADEMAWQVASEALEDAMFVDSVLESVCREEVARLMEDVVIEVVCEVVRSVSLTASKG